MRKNNDNFDADFLVVNIFRAGTTRPTGMSDLSRNIITLPKYPPCKNENYTSKCRSEVTALNNS